MNDQDRRVILIRWLSIDGWHVVCLEIMHSVPPITTTVTVTTIVATIEIDPIFQGHIVGFISGCSLNDHGLETVEETT